MNSWLPLSPIHSGEVYCVSSFYVFSEKQWLEAFPVLIINPNHGVGLARIVKFKPVRLMKSYALKKLLKVLSFPRLAQTVSKRMLTSL